MILLVIKHGVENIVGIKAKAIDDFAYVFVRNLLRGESDMLTTKFNGFREA